VISAMYAVLL